MERVSGQPDLKPEKGKIFLDFQRRLTSEENPDFEVKKIEHVRQNSYEDTCHENMLFHGDNLAVCSYLKTLGIKINLVYIDPPFYSGANYAKKIYLRNKRNISIGEEIMYSDIWKKEDYLSWLYERLLAIKDILDDRGSLMLHLDCHISHYAKIILDEIFGEDNFRNEIVWCYGGGGNPDKYYAQKHDVIFWYSKSSEWTFNKQFRPYSAGTLERGLTKVKGNYKLNKEGAGLNDYWADSEVQKILSPTAYENRKYNTQKPESLLKRIIKGHTDQGMIVADFFSGSGTTAIAAHKLGRKFITCDIGINAIQTTRDALTKEGAEFDIFRINDSGMIKNAASELDTARIEVSKDGDKYKVEIKKYSSPYLAAKIEKYNKKQADPITVDISGHELIESVQFDTALVDNLWISNPELEDKAGLKDKIKGVYYLDTDKFQIKIRNIVGNEIIISNNSRQQ